MKSGKLGFECLYFAFALSDVLLVFRDEFSTLFLLLVDICYLICYPLLVLISCACETFVCLVSQFFYLVVGKKLTAAWAVFLIFGEFRKLAVHLLLPLLSEVGDFNIAFLHTFLCTFDKNILGVDVLIKRFNLVTVRILLRFVIKQGLVIFRLFGMSHIGSGNTHFV